MKIKNLFLQSLIIMMALAAAFIAGFFLHGELYKSGTHFPVLSEAYQIIQEHGYQEIPENPEMEYGAIHGMVSAYQDQHTHFMEPVQTELNNDTLSGSYGGIGAQLGHDSEGFIVLHPFSESPAAKEGLLDGDRLLNVDDIEILPETPIEEVVGIVRGPEGINVRLTIARPPEYAEMEFTVERANIPLPSVTYNLNPDEPRLGVIRVNVIATSTPDEIVVAVQDLQSRRATHFVLDLRGNGGGLLNEGVDIARLFLKDGVVIQHQYKGESIKTFEVKNPGPLVEIPLVILVDGSTASAAEIISGALQYQERAPLIGIHTYGKDSIQLVFELQDKSSLHVTSAKWWVPGLEPPISEGGLVPDQMISSDHNGDTDPYIEASIQYFFGK